VDGYSGDAGNALMTTQASDWTSNGRMFSTPDIDNDAKPDGSCAASHGTGWWYRRCSASRVNAQTNGLWSTGAPVKDVPTSRMLVKLN